MRLGRLIRFGAPALLAGLAALPATASAQVKVDVLQQAPTAGQPSTAECAAIFAHDATGNLTKSFSGSRDNGDGTTTYFYTLHTSRSTTNDQFSDIVDCGVSQNNTNTYGTSSQTVNFNAQGSTTITLTVNTPDRVCDRARLQGTEGNASFQDYSNLVGVSGGKEDPTACPQPGNGIPEAPSAALFILGGGTLIGGVWFVSRRRRLAQP